MERKGGGLHTHSAYGEIDLLADVGIGGSQQNLRKGQDNPGAFSRNPSPAPEL